MHLLFLQSFLFFYFSSKYLFCFVLWQLICSILNKLPFVQPWVFVLFWVINAAFLCCIKYVNVKAAFRIFFAHFELYLIDTAGYSSLFSQLIYNLFNHYIVEDSDTERCWLSLLCVRGNKEVAATICVPSLYRCSVL